MNFQLEIFLKSTVHCISQNFASAQHLVYAVFGLFSTLLRFFGQKYLKYYSNKGGTLIKEFIQKMHILRMKIALVILEDYSNEIDIRQGLPV